MLPATPWIAYRKPRGEATVRLFCFPYAGGAASLFRQWPDEISPRIDVCPVQLPGRENRVSEPLPPDVRQLAENLAERLATYLQTPFALFGHSMGALVCYEFARVLRNRSLPTPAHLFASGWRAPQIPDLDPPTHRLPDHAFLDKVRRLNGTSEGVLEEPELLELVLPLLRGDFALVENYTYQPGMPLDCPISVFGGAHDPKVTREKLEPWRTQTSASFKLRIFPGDHFFLNTSRLELLKAISDELSVHF